MAKNTPNKSPKPFAVFILFNFTLLMDIQIRKSYYLAVFQTFVA